MLAEAVDRKAYQGLIVPNIAFALGTFLFRQLLLRCSAGAGGGGPDRRRLQWRIFYKIHSPLARPVIAALGIIAFLTNWNNFLFPLIVVNTTSMNVVSTGLSVFQTQFSTNYDLITSAALIAIVPILLVAIVAQRQIVEGISLGAVQ